MDTKKDAPNSDLNITFKPAPPAEPKKAVPAAAVTAQKDAEAPSHLANKAGVFNVEKAFSNIHTEEGMILKDKRRRRTSLGQSLKEAFNEWTGKTKENLAGAQERWRPHDDHEAVTITPAASRKEVIEKAATFSHIAPLADQKMSMARIRTYKNDVAKIMKTTTPPSKDGKPKRGTWTHIQEEEAKPAPAPVPAPATPAKVMPQPAPQAQPAPEQKKTDIREAIAKVIPRTQRAPVSTVTHEVPSFTVAPVVTSRIKKEIEDFSSDNQGIADRYAHDRFAAGTQDPFGSVTEVPAPERVIVTDTVSQVKEEANTSPAPVEEVKEEIKTPSKESSEDEMADAQPEFRSTPIPRNVQQELEELRTKAQSSVSQKETVSPSRSKILPMLLRGTMVTAAIAGGVVLAFVAKEQFGKNEPTDIVSAPVLPDATFQNGNTSTIDMAGDSNAFRSELEARIGNAGPGILEIYPVVEEDGAKRPATSQEFLTFMRARLPENTKRALDEHMTIGSVSTGTSEPFIILTSSNFDLLFTGMMAWEQNIQFDLEPIFGIASGSPVSFRDAVRRNASTRILHDLEGNEILLYSFIDQNTVVITTSSEALSAIVSQF